MLWREITTASSWFWRGLKRGDWLWLMLAVMIASSSVTLVSLLGQTVKGSMLRQAADNLGADYVLQSARPIDAKWQLLADSLGLESAQSQMVITMALSGENFQLVQLKAVSDNYPLRQSSVQKDKVKHPIKPNQIWVESSLMALMKLKPKSQILLGETHFQLAGHFVPSGITAGISNFAPQIQMSLSQLPKTGLVGAGSRVQYALSLAGNTEAIEAFSKQVKRADSPYLQAISAQAPSEDLAQSLDTAWLFLELAALSAVLVAGLSILIASRFYLSRWQNSIALMRAFGASEAKMSRMFAFQLSWLAIAASAVGVAVGWLIFQLVLPIVANYFQPLVIAKSGYIYLHGFAMGFLVLWSFAWQAFRNAVKTPAIQLLKTTESLPQTSNWLISFGFILLLVVSITGYVFWVLLGLIVVGFSLYLAAVGLLALLKYWQHHSHGWFKLAIAALVRESALVKIQLISVGLVLFVLMVMTFVRQDLMQNWQASLPKNTPDTFVINVQPDQKATAETLLQQKHLPTELVAMARGRLVKVNGQAIEQETLAPRAKRLLARESNVAVLDEPPKYNTVLQSETSENLATLAASVRSLPKVSVESSIAELFSLKLNDVLTFNFSGQNYAYRISSIREVKWQSFRLNFFFIVEPTDVILPISYIGNFALKNTQVDVQELTKQFAEQTPGVLLIDARRILEQIQTIMAQASWAVSGLYVFTLAASLIVLFTATLASQRSRVQNWLLLRTMGATRNEIVKIGLMEFVLLGALSGLLAGTFAQIVSMAISELVLKTTPHWNIHLWLLSVFSGMLMLLIIGWLTQKQYLKLSPRSMAQKWA